MREAAARRWLAGIQADEDTQGLLLAKKREAARVAVADRHVAHAGETCDAWHDRFLAARGDGPNADARYRWGKWIRPHLGETRRTSSVMLREHLRAAGVTRARLHEDNATAMPVTFRSFRDTGITWLALASIDVVKMQRRAGHDTIETTMGYVKDAEDHTRDGVGQPFPPLPDALVWPGGRPSWPNRWPNARANPKGSARLVVGEQGLERRGRARNTLFHRGF